MVSVQLTRYQPGVEGVVYGRAAKLERTNQWLQSISTEPEMYPYTFGDIPYLQKRKLNGKKTSIQKEPSKISGYNASFVVFLLVISLSCLAVILTTVLNDIIKLLGVRGHAPAGPQIFKSGVSTMAFLAF